MGNTTLNSYNAAGIILANGGAYRSPFTITASGTIKTSGNYGVYSNLSNPSLLNFGFVAATQDGVRLSSGGSVQNLGASSVISGATEAVVIGGASGYLLNQGTLTGASFVDALVDGSSGTIVNDGLVSGPGTGLQVQYGYILNTGLVSAVEGIKLLGSPGTVVNDGTVLAQSFGIIAYGSVVNTGFVSSEGFGVMLANGGTVVNAGTVSAVTAVTLEDGGSALNDGIISALAFGVNVENGGTILNDGTISGNGSAINSYGDATTRLIVDPGAAFIGGVNGSPNASNVLELAGITLSEGHLYGIGSQFKGFQTIAFDPGAAWVISGGTAGLAAGQTITGFTPDDTIILESFAATSDSFATGIGLVLSSATASATIGLAGSFAPSYFTVSTDGASTTIGTPRISLISTSISVQVTLGAGGYGTDLTINSSGFINDANLSLDDLQIGATPIVAVSSGGFVLNDGTIAAGPGIQVAGTGILLLGGNTLINHGEILGGYGTQGYGGPGVYISPLAGSSLINTGTIIGGDGGVDGGNGVENGLRDLPIRGSLGAQIGAELINNGTIFGGDGFSFVTLGTGPGALLHGGYGGTGVILYNGGAFLNNGVISGGTGIRYGGDGVVLSNSANTTLTNAGSITGGIGPGGTLGAAVYVQRGGTFATTIIAEPGAAFIGGVYANPYAPDSLILAGTGPGSLDMGSTFSGLSTIDFSAGSTWTLAGASIALAAGQTITGFLPGDTIILDSFAATSQTIGAAGLTLRNGATTATLDLGPPPPGDSFALSSDGFSTTLSAVSTLVSVISTTISQPVTLGAGGYAASLTITSTGAINNATLSQGVIAANGIYAATLSTGSILNRGTIIAGGGNFHPGIGVDLTGADTLANQGLILGGYGAQIEYGGAGAISSGLSGTDIYNTGIIRGGGARYGGSDGLYLGLPSNPNTQRAFVQNLGTIAGGAAAEFFTLAFGRAEYMTLGGAGGAGLVFEGATILNTGLIIGGAGPVSGGAGVVIDGVGGLPTDGLTGTLINAGTIAGGAGPNGSAGPAIMFDTFGTDANALIADPGAAFIGSVIADPNEPDSLILAGASPGSLGMGSSFTGFSTIDFSAGSAWTLEGASIALAAGQTITGFLPGDTIILDSFAATSQTIGAGGLTLGNAATTETLDITGISQFTVTDNALGGTIIEVACFCSGTRILTPRGNIAIEKLNIGELVSTMHGPQPIRWIGRRAYAARLIRNNPDALPIRIRRHAIALNVPSRDLYVSPDHAIAEGGVLIHAHLLQNGISIHQPERNTDVEYFHLEFDTHTIIFAENLSTESFIDEGAGNRFQNSCTRPQTEKPQKPCLPRVFEGFHLHNIKSRIASRAGSHAPTHLGALRGVIDAHTPTLIRGWAQNSAAPEHPVTLEIISGTQKYLVLANTFRPDVRAAGLGSGCHGFSLTLPNLQHQVSIRRASDGAALQNVGWVAHRALARGA